MRYRRPQDSPVTRPTVSGRVPESLSNRGGGRWHLMSPARSARLPSRGPAAWLPWVLLAHVVVAGIGLVRGRALHVVVDVAAVGVLTGLAFWPGLTERPGRWPWRRAHGGGGGVRPPHRRPVESHFYFFVSSGCSPSTTTGCPSRRPPRGARRARRRRDAGPTRSSVSSAATPTPSSSPSCTASTCSRPARSTSPSGAGTRPWPPRAAGSPRDGRADAGRLRRAPIGMAVVELDGTILRINVRAVHAARTPPRTSSSASTPPRCAGAEAVEELWAMVEAWSADGRGTSSTSAPSTTGPDGSQLWTQVTMAIVCDEAGEPRHILAQVEDVTDEVADAARLAHSATHDPLTDVANRSALEERLEPMIAAANRRDEVLGCLFIDLDDFKSVNDDHGHDVGDALLCEVAGPHPVVPAGRGLRRPPRRRRVRRARLAGRRRRRRPARITDGRRGRPVVRDGRARACGCAAASAWRCTSTPIRPAPTRS